MENKYRVSWLFVANNNLVDKFGNKYIKPLGTRDVAHEDFEDLDSARSFRSELLSIAGDLRSQGLYVELSPYIFSPDVGGLG